MPSHSSAETLAAKPILQAYIATDSIAFATNTIVSEADSIASGTDSIVSEADSIAFATDSIASEAGTIESGVDAFAFGMEQLWLPLV